MPARKLEQFVQMGIKAGAAAGMIEPEKLADTLYTVASRGQNIPLRLPLYVLCHLTTHPELSL